jgi:hypothetical protein
MPAGIAIRTLCQACLITGTRQGGVASDIADISLYHIGAIETGDKRTRSIRAVRTARPFVNE